MHAEVLDEPELEFGGGARHIDPRFGIASYGPADLLSPDAPRAVRLGLIGPADQLDGLSTWLERCREPIPAKDERYPHLFPSFPGCDIDVGLQSTLVLSDRNTRTISPSALRMIENSPPESGLSAAVDAYAEEITALAEENRVDVLLIARPEQLADVARRSSRRTRRAALSKRSEDGGLPRGANFHDLLKARLLHLRQPIQIIRRSTWDEACAPPAGYGRQDEASRAWNLHVALYYKAGGVPWRLLRNPTDLTTCYIGVSFYRNIDDTSLDTAVAQIFNERGDGVIVRGGPARITGSDKQPHLSRDDAHQLLLGALDAYRREHRTMPARVVLHKSSAFTREEIEGFEGGAEDRLIDSLEMAWITTSDGARLFRGGKLAPPLRGTMLPLSDRELILYTTGSVEFYSTYPGHYVPQPIGIRPTRPVRSPRETCAETLALTKMNWNQTRLDGQLPFTQRTARKGKAILRFCPPEQAVATRYAHYM